MNMSIILSVLCFATQKFSVIVSEKMFYHLLPSHYPSGSQRVSRENFSGLFDFIRKAIVFSVYIGSM